MKLQLEKGSIATSYEPYKESNAYVIAKDEQGNVLELRSLPNGVKDEFSLTQGKLIKRVSDEVVLDGSYNWVLHTTDDTKTILRLSPADTPLIFPNSINSNVQAEKNSATYGYNADMIFSSALPVGTVGRAVFADGAFYIALPLPNSTLADAKNYLNNKPVKLIYQLAEPEIIPVEASGSLVSYPNGTIYVEKVVPDAGIYTTKFDIKDIQLPIKGIDKLIKYDFETGVQTVLYTSLAVISEDKKSFTHPDLTDKDIVFVDYFYDVESTLGETTIEYLDSRYTIKDTINNKFYKWEIKSTNGVPTLELTEVP